MPRRTNRADQRTAQHAHPVNGSNDEIFIVDDDRAVCEALALFFTLAGFRVTTFGDGRSVIHAARQVQPACILLDMFLPNESGLDILRQLDAGKFAAPIFIISGRSDIPTAVAAVKNGAFDFLEKQMDAETIVGRVRQTVDAWACRRGNRNRLTGDKTLTRREQEVLTHIAAGATNREAATSLAISVRTVETHRARIKKKLGAKNTVELARISLRLGPRHS